MLGFRPPPWDGHETITEMCTSGMQSVGARLRTAQAADPAGSGVMNIPTDTTAGRLQKYISVTSP